MTDPPRAAPATRALSDTDFAAPIDDRYFEDYEPGAAYEYGSVLVDSAEMVEFARRFDPQPTIPLPGPSPDRASAPWVFPPLNAARAPQGIPRSSPAWAPSGLRAR